MVLWPVPGLEELSRQYTDVGRLLLRKLQNLLGLLGLGWSVQQVGTRGAAAQGTGLLGGAAGEEWEAHSLPVCLVRVIRLQHRRQ